MFNFDLFDQRPDLFELTTNKIKHEWQPDWRWNDESLYRDDLFRFILKRLGPTHRINEAGRGLADIGIELKLNLKGKPEINRLDVRKLARAFASHRIFG